MDKLTIHAEVRSGNEDFDEVFLISSPDPEFAKEVLTPELIRWMLADPRARRFRMIWEAEALTPADDGLPKYRERAVLSVGAEGHLTDEALSADLLDYACDLHAQLPNTLLGVVE